MKFKGLHGLEMRHGGALIGWGPLCRVHSQGVPVQMHGDKQSGGTPGTIAPTTTVFSSDLEPGP